MDRLIRVEDLVNNPTPRVPICLCLDTSGSMSGEAINELNSGVKAFYDEVKQDEVAFYAAELCIVAFNNEAELVLDFANIERQSLPKLSASGATAMGEGVNFALDLLEQRKQEYKDKGVDYFQPWLVLMSDGEPNGDKSELVRAISRANALINEKKLTVFPIAIGDECDEAVLGSFSPKRGALKLQGLKFREFFAWLSKSVSKTSQSTPGELVNFDKEGMTKRAVKPWTEGLYYTTNFWYF